MPTCVECACTVAEKRIPAHITWHVKLASAIMRASGVMTAQELEQQEAKVRLYMQGKFSTI